jgi:hypothetical protein
MKYYELRDGVIMPIVRKVEINCADYNEQMTTKYYTAWYNEDEKKSKWVIDIHLGTGYTVVCAHFGEVLIVLSLLNKAFPKKR